MAPRQTARRLLVAVPALALAFAVTACTPPNEEPADPDAPYTLPTYTGDAEAEESADEVEGEMAGAEGEVGEGEAMGDEGAATVTTTVVVEVPAGEPGQNVPAAPPAP
ncbi:hypothetical protein [Dietzia sp. PP-33]|jgi:hypothetical protein|uniref:hypothetical protein n=1 Tax=Dietzia sp. PP-33 TaxID=2957500 RepID=UPI0029B93D72|nr:hypothetical protein [Dietzia sp. PP-33]MDX2356133.1 hypothetical protein [Dietzia sp. PP-33]